MSDGTNGLARFWAAVGGHVDARAEPRRARRVLTIATIERDSTGAAVTARGTIGGEGDFSIDVRGRGVREGMRIGVVGPANDPYAPLAFADIDQTDDPSAAYGDVNADLPVPTFASTPFTTVIVKSPGSVTARGSVFFNAVAERYHPDYYLLSWRLTSGPGEWRRRDGARRRDPPRDWRSRCAVGTRRRPRWTRRIFETLESRARNPIA
jgi:hypothetical protein